MAEIEIVESPVVTAIYKAIEGKAKARHSPRLSASTLGHECSRKLWYEFRWAHDPETFSGRMLRLFETGEVEERRLIDNLRLAGVDVSETDPFTGEQWRVTFGMHVSGRLDGIASGVPSAPKTDHVLECKSHSEKSFNDLKKKGVKASKPLHYTQMQLYMHGTGLTRALYLGVNKNTDELYAERIEYDFDHCINILSKAEGIIFRETAPAKLHEDPDAKMAFTCRSCPALKQCHEGALALRNCRTCLHSTVTKHFWHCDLHKTPLSDDDQKEGCACHTYLPDLVPYEQIDCDEATGTVTYKKPDGSLFIDGMTAENGAGRD